MILGGALTDRQDAPRVQQIEGIQALLDGAHHPQCHRRLVMLQVCHLEASDPVFSRYGAAKGMHRVEDQLVDLLFMLAQEPRTVRAGGCLNVVVKIAVTQVPEIDHAHAWQFLRQQGVRCLNKGSDGRYRQ